MRENIIEQLRFCAAHFSCDGCGGNCKSGSNEPRTKAVLNDATDAIEELESYCKELESKVPHWISVEERLPGKDDMVFVYYEWTGQSGTVYKEVSLSTLGEIQHFGFKPIAWMPLPDPQKEETE